MTKYKLPEQIDHVDSSKPLIDDTVIKGSYKIVATIEERNLIPILKRSIHNLVTVVGDSIKEFKGATIEDTDWLEDSNWVSIGLMLPGIILIDDGESIIIKNKDTDATMAVIDRNGQFKSYGRQGVANGSFNTYTYDGYIRIEQNTLQGNYYLKMYDSSDNLIVHIDTAGVSKLLGLDVQNQDIINVKSVQFQNDVTYTDEQKQAMPISSTFWDNEAMALTTKVSADVYMQHNRVLESNVAQTPRTILSGTNLGDNTGILESILGGGTAGQALKSNGDGSTPIWGEAGAVKSVNGQTGDVVIPQPVGNKLVLWHNYGGNY